MRLKWTAIISAISALFVSMTVFAADETPVVEKMPFQKESLVSTSDFAHVMLLTIAVLAALVVILFVIRKRLVPKGMIPENTDEKTITVIQNKRLTPKTTLSLVDVSGKEVLVAIHKDAISMLELGNAKTESTPPDINKYTKDEKQRESS